MSTRLVALCAMPNTLQIMSIDPNLQLLLHLIDRHAGCTVVQLTDHLKPYAPSHDPYTQQEVRSRLKALLTNGLVQLAHHGKPRTYVRTQHSYRVVPSSWTPDAEALRRRTSRTVKR